MTAPAVRPASRVAIVLPLLLWGVLGSPALTRAEDALPAKPEAPVLVPYRKGRLWGFSDLKKNLVIPPKYAAESAFSEGLAVEAVDGKYGFIDREGKTVIPFQYDAAGNFHDGLAAVWKNKKGSFIDATGKTAIPEGFDGIWGFTGGLAQVRVGQKRGYIDRTGKLVVPAKYDNPGDLWGAGEFSNGFCTVRLNGKYGYVDRTGQEIAPCKYDEARLFHDGLAVVMIGNATDDSQKYGFIDATGKEVIPVRYYTLDEFSDGLAKARLPDPSAKPGDERIRILDGYIDKSGKAVLGFSTDYYGGFAFKEGLAWVGKNLIDKSGKAVIQGGPDYTVSGSFSEGLACVSLNDKEGFIEKTGKVVIPIVYDSNPFGMNMAKDFERGVAAVYRGDKLGLIDRTGKELTPFKYFMMQVRENGLVYVWVDEGQKEVGYVGLDGVEYFEP